MTVAHKHSAELAVVESPGRVVVLDLTRLDRPPVVLEGTAAEIWHAIDGVRDDETICTDLAASYGMLPEQIRADVLACLTQLTDLGLVQQDNHGG